jgi:hypothetical protein
MTRAHTERAIKATTTEDVGIDDVSRAGSWGAKVDGAGLAPTVAAGGLELPDGAPLGASVGPGADVVLGSGARVSLAVGACVGVSDEVGAGDAVDGGGEVAPNAI